MISLCYAYTTLIERPYDDDLPFKSDKHTIETATGTRPHAFEKQPATQNNNASKTTINL
jgi:hypothetical protein